MNRIILIVCAFLLLSPAGKGQDIAGSRDHSLVSRYPGATIRYYETQNFKSYKIATGPVTGYKKIDKWMSVEGKFTRIYYVVKGERSLEEIYRNYVSAFKKEGFTIVAQGIDPQRNVAKEIGGRSFLGVVYDNNSFPPGKGINIMHGSATSGGSCYLAASLTRNGASVHAVLGGAEYKTDEKVLMLDIIEEKPMEDGLVAVTADKMMEGIKRDGKVDIYGIYFDFDKADIKPESAATLEELSALLKNNAGLKLAVVGHTDGKGSAQYNMDLSTRRAKAIVNELVSAYGISASRLKAEGKGASSPIASNDTEDGRKLNRRVELKKLP